MNNLDKVVYHVEQKIDRKLGEEEKNIFIEIYIQGLRDGAEKMWLHLDKEHSEDLKKYGDQLKEITAEINKENENG